MKALCSDLLSEYRELAVLAATLAPADWARRSHFHGWTPWDEVAHLAYFDEAALAALADAGAFAREAADLRRRMDAGEAISAIARARYGHFDGPALLAFWEGTFERLVASLAGLDPKARLPWYGPPMSARSFATARLMETWAHGQDVWDVTGRRRPASARLRHIAHLGVTTFGWTFANRGLPVPATAPYVELAAPDGGTWTWGDPASPERVRGPAQAFCLVVTQRRHVADTPLACEGPAARAWLAMAQCFAGPPADPPLPGLRRDPA